MFVSKITFDNVNGNYLLMLGLKRDMIYDQDASLSNDFDGGVRTSATIVSNYPHIETY